MQVIKYSYQRSYNGFDEYEAKLVVKVSNQELAANMISHSLLPEHIVRRKLEALIINKIQDQLFGR